MIKFTAQVEDNKTLVGFGLSSKNLEILKKGKPMLIKLEDLGLNPGIEILIFHGETEQDMIDDLQSRIGKATVIHHGGKAGLH